MRLFPISAVPPVSAIFPQLSESCLRFNYTATSGQIFGCTGGAPHKIERLNECEYDSPVTTNSYFKDAEGECFTKMVTG